MIFSLVWIFINMTVGRYREAVYFLYSSYTFNVEHPLTIVDLSATLLPQRVNIIRSLCLTIPINDARMQYHYDRQMSRRTGDKRTTAEKAFEIISKMESLKILKVKFDGCVGNIGEKPGRKIELLLPLSCVRQTDIFEVSVPWNRREDEEKLLDVPYVLHWCDPQYADDGDDGSPWNSDSLVSGYEADFSHSESESESDCDSSSDSEASARDYGRFGC